MPNSARENEEINEKIRREQAEGGLDCCSKFAFCTAVSHNGSLSAYCTFLGSTHSSASDVVSYAHRTHTHTHTHTHTRACTCPCVGPPEPASANAFVCACPLQVICAPAPSSWASTTPSKRRMTPSARSPSSRPYGWTIVRALTSSSEIWMCPAHSTTCPFSVSSLFPLFFVSFFPQP
eukprot:scaffold31359_cov20-Tisochrysis_lutea.AAC.2